MSFDLLRTESVSPRAVSGGIVVEFVDSKPQQQAAGKKKSRREQVVIEIDYTSAKPLPQQAPEPVVAAATSTRHTEPLKTTVDDRALEIARSSTAPLKRRTSVPSRRAKNLRNCSAPSLVSPPFHSQWSCSRWRKECVS